MEKRIKSSYKIYFLIILSSLLVSDKIYNNCSICLLPINDNYLIDAWGNKFHSKHTNQGHYCNSCSRLISETITHGGYKTQDNRYICSLCYVDLIFDNKAIESARNRVLKQLEKIGFSNLYYDIPIILLDEIDLIKISKTDYHKNVKGFTVIHKNNGKKDYKIYILNNLHQIEFDAVLAHEYLHVWQSSYNIFLNEPDSEGLCNLGSELIYNNYNNTFSKILNKNLMQNNDKIYGDGYKKMKMIKDQTGWNGLIRKIMSNYSY